MKFYIIKAKMSLNNSGKVYGPSGTMKEVSAPPNFIVFKVHFL